MEKMISGMYMGELVRIVLEDLARQNMIFDGDYDAISRHGCFPTKFVSEIERYFKIYIFFNKSFIKFSEVQEQEENQFQKTQTILEDIGIRLVTTTDCANVGFYNSKYYYFFHFDNLKKNSIIILYFCLKSYYIF